MRFLAGNHRDLSVCISEHKDVKATAKAFIAAQSSGKIRSQSKREGTNVVLRLSLGGRIVQSV